MSAATQTPTEPPPSPSRGPACGACVAPDGAGSAAEAAFACEHCDAPVCGFCVAADGPDWLCDECARRVALTSGPAQSLPTRDGQIVGVAAAPG